VAGGHRGPQTSGSACHPRADPGRRTACPTLTYAFAPLKHARLDYMVQKAVEMGASILQPVLTRHTKVSRMNGERMRANVIEAAEQCGILNLAEVADPVPLDRFLHAARPENASWCSAMKPPNSPIPCKPFRLGPQGGSAGSPRVDVLIGPEGGFAEEDARDPAAATANPKAFLRPTDPAGRHGRRGCAGAGAGGHWRLERPPPRIKEP